MRSLITVLNLVFTLYIYVVFAMAIMSWLLNFNVINFHNEIVRSIWRFLTAVTEPLLRPIRRFMPNLGGIDLSPIVLLLIIYFLQDAMFRYIYPYVY